MHRLRQEGVRPWTLETCKGLLQRLQRTTGSLQQLAMAKYQARAGSMAGPSRAFSQEVASTRRATLPQIPLSASMSVWETSDPRSSCRRRSPRLSGFSTLQLVAPGPGCSQHRIAWSPCAPSCRAKPKALLLMPRPRRLRLTDGSLVLAKHL